LHGHRRGRDRSATVEDDRMRRFPVSVVTASKHVNRCGIVEYYISLAGPPEQNKQ